LSAVTTDSGTNSDIFVMRRDYQTFFADDAIIHEPFSNTDGALKGKSAIKPFLQIAIMPNEGMRQEIEFEKLRISKRNNTKNDENRIQCNTLNYP
jgi:hypothetical protein